MIVIWNFDTTVIVLCLLKIYCGSLAERLTPVVHVVPVAGSNPSQPWCVWEYKKLSYTLKSSRIRMALKTEVPLDCPRGMVYVSKLS